MAKVLERPKTEHVQTLPLDQHYQAVCDLLPKHRVELIHDRIVVNEVPTWNHNKAISRLLKQIIHRATEHDWDIGTHITLFLGAQADRYIPDLTVASPEPRTWGDDQLYAADTLLVVEVVSPSSVHDDYAIKPGGYAAAGVPLFLRIDPLKGICSLMSHPSDRGVYLHHTDVAIGEPLDLPGPWKLTLDTGKLVDE
ncbi:Uma2 family endonuclease [Nonomuraea muscovyensis]|jgi:Uma2 family endonuclease|uniref:Uma2 family endonuclease n=1 Tax=Nonomuraea muscovyensis TaxID=1124761 RepID=A0A7X0CCD1_9ACTN|nr:Uma2 family endonuclease [Nonomuraea muscovyensis]MBB6351555.1 Uma2 family endonuclease [Nonomuraea muscovyensis]MDF2708045.1 hypothetical protein [Nonomuraea muscovyensis]